MPKITVKSPDGRKAILNVPDGADESLINKKIASVKEMLGGAAPQPEANSSAEQAFVGEEEDPNAPSLAGVASGASRIAARHGPAILGAKAGGMLTGGNPIGMGLGAAIGEVGGILFTEPNQPVGETVVEAGTAGAGFALPGAKSVLEAMAQGGVITTLSHTASELMDGKPLPSVGEQAISTVTGALLAGGAHKYLDVKPEFKELLGDEEAADKAARIMRGQSVPGMIKESRELRESIARLQSGVSKKTSRRMQGVIDDLSELEDFVAKPVPADPQGLGKISKFMGRFDVKKSELERIQRTTGYSTFDDYLTVRFAHEGYDKEVHGAAETIEKLFKGTSRSQRIKMTQELVGGEGGKVREQFDHYLEEFGLGADEFFGEIVPKVAAGEAPRTMSKRLRGLAEYIDNGDVAVEEPDALLALSRLAKASLFRKHVGDAYAEAATKYGSHEVPAEVREPMMKYLNNIRGKGDDIGRHLTDAINEGLAVLDPAAERMLGKKLRSSSQELVSHLMNASYSGLLGFRAGPLIRNASQPVQLAGPLMGGRWLGRGYMRYLTSEGRAQAAAAGMKGQALSMAEVEELARSFTGRKLAKISRVGLAPYSKVEDINRSSVYLGMHDKVKWAAGKAGDDVNKFLDISDIDRYKPGEIDAILSKYNVGDVDGAADLAARFMVDRTQFLYGGAERPDVMTGTVGKIATGFGTWPANYGKYILENFIPGTSYGPGTKRVRDLLRFFAANAAIGGIFAGIGYKFGDQDSIKDAFGWTFAGPLFYTGGPIPQTAISAVRTGREVYEGKMSLDDKRFLRAKGGPGIAEFQRNVKGFIPGHAAYEDISRSLEEPTGTEGVGRFLGFKRGKQ